MSGGTGTGGTASSKLDELHARSIIEFPKPIVIERVRDLFSHIKTGGVYMAELYVDQTEPFGTREINLPDVTKITGRIEEAGQIMRSASFTLDREFDNTSEVSIFPRLSFKTIPGYSLVEHREEEVKVWDGTREAVKAYFASL
jgi:hypothetical protein